LPVAAVAEYLARVSWIYSFKRPASILSFDFRNYEKAAPGHVTDCSGETVILDHPTYVQIIDRDRVKSSDRVPTFNHGRLVAQPYNIFSLGY